PMELAAEHSLLLPALSCVPLSLSDGQSVLQILCAHRAGAWPDLRSYKDGSRVAFRMETARTSPPSIPADSGNRAPVLLLRCISRLEFSAALAVADHRADRHPYWRSATQLESLRRSPHHRNP